MKRMRQRVNYGSRAKGSKHLASGAMHSCADTLVTLHFNLISHMRLDKPCITGRFLGPGHCRMVVNSERARLALDALRVTPPGVQHYTSVLMPAVTGSRSNQPPFCSEHLEFGRHSQADTKQRQAHRRRG